MEEISMKRPAPTKNRCPYCGDYYIPYIRAVTTQKSCDKATCRKKRQQEAYKAWRAENPDYFRGRYKSKVKAWLAARPGYLRQYRASHPEYVVKDNHARLARMQKHKRFHSDIQNGLFRRKIAGIRAISCSDIQNGLGLKVDGILNLLSG
jgi:hypothetical protein